MEVTERPFNSRMLKVDDLEFERVRIEISWIYSYGTAI
jgi:hypothetical protein